MRSAPTRPVRISPPSPQVLADAGFHVFAVDGPGFGRRRSLRPRLTGSIRSSPLLHELVDEPSSTVRSDGPLVGRCDRRPVRRRVSRRRASARPPRQRSHRLRDLPDVDADRTAEEWVAEVRARRSAPCRGARPCDVRLVDPVSVAVAGDRRARDPDAALPGDRAAARRRRIASTSAASRRRCHRPKCAGSRAQATGSSTMSARRSATRSPRGSSRKASSENRQALRSHRPERDTAGAQPRRAKPSRKSSRKCDGEDGSALGGVRTLFAVAMTTNELREAFQRFYEERGHLRVPGHSLIPPAEDQTTLFIIAGMQQFKPYFLRTKEPPSNRVVSVQPCLRAGGKDNDLDEVGPHRAALLLLRDDGQLLVRRLLQGRGRRLRVGVGHRVLELEPERLWATVHEGDPVLELGEDDGRDRGLAARRHPAGAHRPARQGQLLAGGRNRALRAVHRDLLRPRRGATPAATRTAARATATGSWRSTTSSSWRTTCSPATCSCSCRRRTSTPATASSARPAYCRTSAPCSTPTASS